MNTQGKPGEYSTSSNLGVVLEEQLVASEEVMDGVHTWGCYWKSSLCPVRKSWVGYSPGGGTGRAACGQ